MASSNSERKLKNLVINKVDSQATFDQMKESGLINTDELYLIKEGTKDRVLDVIVNGESTVIDGISEFNVPTVVSELENDSGYITTAEETDPVFSASAAAGITSNDIQNWNNKTSSIGTITGVSINGTSIATSGVANITSVPASILTGAIPNGVTATTQTQSDNSTKIATTAYVDTAIGNLPEPMVFKGSLGTGGTITVLPTAEASNEGHTYKVIKDGTYAGQAAKIGDTFISTGSRWELIPSGDEPSGTVTSITLNAISPIAIDNSAAITTSGTRTISHASSGVSAGTYKSVTVNSTGHVTGGTNPTTLSGYGITDAKIANGAITLGSNTITPLTEHQDISGKQDKLTTQTAYSAKGSATKVPQITTNTLGQVTGITEVAITDNDTKNTAGSTDTSSKIFLVGATSQAANPQTYSHDTAYVGTDGCLYSGGTKVLTAHQDISGKQDKLTAQTAYNAKGSATKVPQITTNILGQVTGITEVTIAQPTVNNATLTIQKNGTNVATFGANASSNVTANITVPTVTDTYSASSSDAMSGKAVASALSSFSGGPKNIKDGDGTGSVYTSGTNKPNANYAFAEGSETQALENYSHAEGYSTISNGSASHAEGYGSFLTALDTTVHTPYDSTNKSIIIKGVTGAEDIINDYIIAGQAYLSANKGSVHPTYKIKQIDEVYGQDARTIIYFKETPLSDITSLAANAQVYLILIGSLASGQGAHAEGDSTIASGWGTHAEGYSTKALEWGAHAEGKLTIASGEGAHAEGLGTIASYQCQHVEGKYNKLGSYIHIVGNGVDNNNRSNAYTLDHSGNAWFAGDIKIGGTGYDDSNAKVINVIANLKDGDGVGSVYTSRASKPTANYAFAEGYGTQALEMYSHAEGYQTISNGAASHAEGYGSFLTALDTTVHTIYDSTEKAIIIKGIVTSPYSGNIISDYIIAGQAYLSTNGSAQQANKIKRIDEVYENDVTVIYFEGTPSSSITSLDANAPVSLILLGSLASGQGAHAEGTSTIASKLSAHAEGDSTVASNRWAHAEGYSTLASAQSAHAEGKLTVASGENSHAEGLSTTASEARSHAEGNGTTASGEDSHAEGLKTISLGYYSHAEGNGTIASGTGSHAEGFVAKASGSYSHAEGFLTEASGSYQHVQGQYNIKDTSNKYAHIVGNGVDDNNRANAHTLDWDGNAWFAGNIKIGGTGYDDSNAKVINTISNLKDGDGIGSVYTSGANKPTVNYAFAEGYNTEARGVYSHAEGSYSIASGQNSHAEGYSSIASGKSSHAENGAGAGSSTTYASGTITSISSDKKVFDISGMDMNLSYRGFQPWGKPKITAVNKNFETNIITLTFEEAVNSYSVGQAIQLIFDGNQAIGDSSHAEGIWTIAAEKGSHAEGYRTSTNREYQHVQGELNAPDSSAIFIIGNGYNNNKSNAMTVQHNGSLWVSSDIKVGGTKYDNATATVLTSENFHQYVDAYVQEILNRRY